MSFIPGAIAFSVFALMTIAGATAAEGAGETSPPTEPGAVGEVEFTVSPDRVEFKKGMTATNGGGAATDTSSETVKKRVDKSSPMLMQGTDSGSGTGTTTKQMDKSTPQ
jgi:hypothetical protein